MHRAGRRPSAVHDPSCASCDGHGSCYCYCYCWCPCACAYVERAHTGTCEATHCKLARSASQEEQAAAQETAWLPACPGAGCPAPPADHPRLPAPPPESPSPDYTTYIHPSTTIMQGHAKATTCTSVHQHASSKASCHGNQLATVMPSKVQTGSMSMCCRQLALGLGQGKLRRLGGPGAARVPPRRERRRLGEELHPRSRGRRARQVRRPRDRGASSSRHRHRRWGRRRGRLWH
jgi:hypothetical protein